MSDKRLTAARPKGHITISGPDGVIEADTLQCVHCGGHWRVEPGSGKLRGFCANCNGPVCGPSCADCVPFEKQMEIMEGTRSPGAVSVNVSEIWTPGSNP